MKGEKSSIVFRADGNSEMGLGHIIRSSALAGYLKNDFDCLLATRCTIKGLLEEMKMTFKEIIRLPEGDYQKEAKDFAALFPGKPLLLLDGYAFDDRYQQSLMQEGFDIFSIDDIHAFRFYSKAIINHGGGVSVSEYKALPGTQFYLGPHYALLREPFLLAARQRETRQNKNCFVCFGGADPSNKTLEVLQKITGENAFPFENIHVVTGSAYQYKSVLENFVKDHQNITVHQSLSPEKMCQLMGECAYAICSPSTVVYEYMSVGGVVFLEQIADNQADIIKYLLDDGLAFPLHAIGTISEEKMQSSLEKQRFFFDGRSDERFRKIFKTYFLATQIDVRKATPQDLQLCFNWANDPEVRAQSYNQQPVSLEDHSYWYHQKMQDPNSFFYILEMQGRPIAQIRFQLKNDEATIGYLAAAEVRSMGLGTTILSKGIEKFVCDVQRHVKIIGLVKASNPASQRSFEKLAFSKQRSTEFPDSYKYTMNYGN